MYKMVIVDDEKVEREGILHFMDWSSRDIEIVGTAWNGQEGLGLIRRTKPDIILTDVKMPVMDGIKMIEQALPDCPDSVFVVLSGYGDYEYTSCAMQLGVRHYILKPCDGGLLAERLEKVKTELAQMRGLHKEIAGYTNSIENLLPRAKIQFFKSLLEGNCSESEILFYRDKCVKEEEGVILIVFMGEMAEIQLSSFVVENIFEELVGQDQILMKTELEGYVVFMLYSSMERRASQAIPKLKYQFKQIFGMELRCIISDKGEFAEAKTLYQYAVYKMSNAWEKINHALSRLEYDKMRHPKDMEELLMEWYVAFCFFHMEALELIDIAQACMELLTRIYGRDASYQTLEECNKSTEIYERAILLAMEKEQMTQTQQTKLLLLTYQYASERQMSLQWLAREILFMNEDYLGRIFKAQMKQKFPDYLNKIRMEAAGRLLKSYPDCLVTRLAEVTGYSEDGQYFCRMFKKYFGITVSDWRP